MVANSGATLVQTMRNLKHFHDNRCQRFSNNHVINMCSTGSQTSIYLCNKSPLSRPQHLVECRHNISPPCCLVAAYLLKIIFLHKLCGTPGVTKSIPMADATNQFFCLNFLKQEFHICIENTSGAGSVKM